MRTFSLICISLVIAFSSLSAKDKYVIGVGNYEYFPFHSIENGEFKGYARDLMDLFSKTENVEIEYKALPWKRLVKLFTTTKKIDAVYPDNPYWDTEEKKGSNVIYSDATNKYQDGVVVRAENKNAGVDHLKVLGTIRGFTAWTYYDQIESGKITLRESGNFTPMLKMLEKKRTDGAYIEYSVAKYHIKQMGLEGKLVFDDSLPSSKGVYQLSSIQHPELIKTFNKFLKKHAKEVKALKNKWGIKQ